MDVILWRHAHAGDPVLDTAKDMLRPLTAKGERQAERVAKWLNRQLPESTKVWVSPATRAQQTAASLGRTCKTADWLAPSAPLADALKAIRFPAGRDPVLLVGHQPMLGQLLQHWLCPSQAADSIWSVRKAGVWWLRYREREGQGALTVVAVVGPDCV